jgi:cytochrome b561
MGASHNEDVFVMRNERYDSVAIALHWLIAVLIVANIAIAWSLDLFDHHSPEHDRVLTIHKSVGTTVLLLAALRLAWRWTHPAPSLPLAMPAWQQLAARASHLLLYLVMFVMPVTGLIDSAAFSEPVRYFFLFDLPVVIAHNEPLGHAAFAVHQATALILYGLLLVHAGAALYHHYFMKDDVLRRMLPGK